MQTPQSFTFGFSVSILCLLGGHRARLNAMQVDFSDYQVLRVVSLLLIPGLPASVLHSFLAEEASFGICSHPNNTVHLGSLVLPTPNPLPIVDVTDIVARSFQ